MSPRRPALIILSDTYRNGTGVVAVTAPEALATEVEARLAALAEVEGCGPIDRANHTGHRLSNWMLRCRAEDADRLRGDVCRALRDVR